MDYTAIPSGLNFKQLQMAHKLNNNLFFFILVRSIDSFLWKKQLLVVYKITAILLSKMLACREDREQTSIF